MNKFDRILWRVNGALFFLCLLGLIIFQWPNISPMLSRPAPRPPSPAVVRETQGTHDKELLRFGTPTRVSGTTFLRMPLQSETDSDSLSPNERTGRVYNYLYVDVMSLSSWLLFKNSDQLISQVHDIRVETAEHDRATVATFFGVVSADTDGDRRLTMNDRESMFFCGADGRNPSEIISSTDEILSVEQIAPDQVLVIYQRGADTIGTVFSTQNGVRIRESTLAVNGSR